MDFDDEAMLSEEGYAALAKAYQEAQSAYLFVRLDGAKEEQALDEVFEVLNMLKSNLFALSGFLGTGALFNLNNKHIENLQNLFSKNCPQKRHRFVADKTKCFLNMLSLESLAIEKMLELALCSSFSEEIVRMIKERTLLCGSLFKINGVISSYFQ